MFLQVSVLHHTGKILTPVKVFGEVLLKVHSVNSRNMDDKSVIVLFIVMIRMEIRLVVNGSTLTPLEVLRYPG